MNKQVAIQKIKEIQNGYWDRHNPECPKGRIIERLNLWNDNNFSYGMEYGAIVALMQVFNITIEDL